MSRPPVRLLLLEANSHAAQRLVESLGAGFAVARHATLAAAEEELVGRSADCVLCGPEAAASLRGIDLDVPIVVRGDVQPAHCRRPRRSRRRRGAGRSRRPLRDRAPARGRASCTTSRCTTLSPASRTARC